MMLIAGKRVGLTITGSRFPRASHMTMESICRSVILIVTLAVFLFGIHSKSCSAETNATKRQFTVRDSIELSHIVNPARSTTIELRGEQPLGAPIYSPDGRYFLLVTQRGILSDNVLEGTIWIFEQRAVSDYVLGKIATKPVPRKLVTVRAATNMPVIEDVRWIDGSKRIAFLGKDGTPYQRLFMANVGTGSIRAITMSDLYVTAYEINGDIVVYTTLVGPPFIPFGSEMIDVGRRTLDQLLYKTPPPIEDMQESLLLKYASSLHLQKHGKDTNIHFTMDGSPLRLFTPTLSLSPDAKSLITVAPTSYVPRIWEKHQPRFESFRLKSGPVPRETNLMTGESWSRPEQYVMVDLETGSASSLVDAPVGRDLGYGDVPTEAFWLADNKRVILTNTFLPFPRLQDERMESQKTERPTIAVIDTSNGKVQTRITLTQLALNSEPEFFVKDITWDESKQGLTLRFESSYGAFDTVSPPAPETYELRSDELVRLQERDYPNKELESGVGLTVRQDLNHPPALWTKPPGSAAECVIWDPNPQLKELTLGKASVYRWRDFNGKKRSGILALPPNYDATRRYPLVIQTHGFHIDRFFADGEYTTGSGGRALVAKNVIVFQIDEDYVHSGTPEEGPDQIVEFEATINQLTEAGLADRDRVGIIGFSRTCFHVLYALTHRPHLFRTATITDGYTASYAEYMLHAAPGNQHERDAEAVNGGVPFGDNLANWIRNAPNFSLDKVGAPLLISVFAKGILLYEWETYSGLRRLNKPVEMLWWWRENSPHLLVQPRQRYASQETAVDWFDFWLNGHENPDHAKAEQYARWRELRKLQAENDAKDKAAKENQRR